MNRLNKTAILLAIFGMGVSNANPETIYTYATKEGSDKVIAKAISYINLCKNGNKLSIVNFNDADVDFKKCYVKCNDEALYQARALANKRVLADIDGMKDLTVDKISKQLNDVKNIEVDDVSLLYALSLLQKVLNFDLKVKVLFTDGKIASDLDMNVLPKVENLFMNQSEKLNTELILAFKPTNLYIKDCSEDEISAEFSNKKLQLINEKPFTSDENYKNLQLEERSSKDYKKYEITDLGMMNKLWNYLPNMQKN